MEIVPVRYQPGASACIETIYRVFTIPIGILRRLVRGLIVVRRVIVELTKRVKACL